MPSALPLLLLADTAVESGRRALDHWFRYPWYDSKTDGVRRVEAAPDSAGPDWDWGLITLPQGLLRWTIWIIIGLLLSVVAYLLVRAYLRRRAGAAADGKARATDPGEADRIQSLPVPPRAGRLDLLDEARRLYHEGNYSQAIVALFSYQLLQLDRWHLIRLARGKTNRQCLREIAARGPLVRLCEHTMVVFEDVFFGRHALGRDRFESCWSRLDEFHSLAGVERT